MSAGTTVSVAPVPPTYGWYSGKYGANVTISLPGSVTARNACASAAVAPAVGKMCAGVYPMPKRRLSESAIAPRTDSIPTDGLYPCSAYGACVS